MTEADIKRVAAAIEPLIRAAWPIDDWTADAIALAAINAYETDDAPSTEAPAPVTYGGIDRKPLPGWGSLDNNALHDRIRNHGK